MMHTDRLGLPLLAAGQAQKEITHNEALSRIDVIAQAAVESADLSIPPVAPEAGQCWVVGAGAIAAWLGKEGMIASWTASGWLFLTPGPDWRAWVRDRGHMIRFDGANWVDDPVRNDGLYLGDMRVVAARQEAIEAPDGGVIRDLEARHAVAAILSALRAHGLIEG